MKLKTKLLSALASAVVGTTSLSAVAACTYSAKKSYPVDAFTVRSKDGSTSWFTDEQNERVVNVDFELNRELSTKYSEKITVSCNSNDVSATILEQPSSTSFSIRFKMLNVVSVYDDKVKSFSLLFKITNSYSKSASFLLSNLKLTYNGSFEPMEVSFANGRDFTSEIGDPKIKITGLQASRMFKESKHETISEIILTGDQSEISNLVISDIAIVGRNIDFAIGIKNPVLTQDYGTLHFGIKPVITADNINGSRELNEINGFSFTYRPQWENNSVIGSNLTAEHTKLTVDATSSDKTGVNFISSPGNYGLYLERQLKDNESLSVSSSIPNYITVGSTPTIKYESSKYWLDLRFGITAAGIQQWAKDKTPFEVALTFKFYHPNGSVSQDFTTHFFIDYKVPVVDTVFTMPTEVTGEAGDTAIVATGSYTNQAKGKKITGTITNVVLSETAQSEGYTAQSIKIRETKTNDDTNGISLYFDLAIKPEDAYVNGISFSVTYTLSGSGLTTETHVTNVVYNKAVPTNNPEEFARSRSVSIMTRYTWYGVTYGIFASAWVVGDATPTVDNDYVYYVATSKSKATDFINWYNNYYGIFDSFAFGVCDYQMATSSTTYTGEGGNSVTVVGADPMEDYVFCDASKVEWVNDTFTWNNSPAEKTYGCDIKIAKLNLGEIVLGAKTDADVWKAFANKCDKLNGYAAANNHMINTTIKKLPTTIPNDIFVGGFSATRYYWYKKSGDEWVINENKYFSYMNEEYEPLVASNLVLTSTDSYRTQHGSELIVKNSGIYRGSPQLASKTTSTSHLYYNDFDGGIGSMVFIRDDSSLGPNESPFKIIGIYWGGYDKSTTSQTIKPYFDFIVDETGQNMLSDYNIKIPQ